MNDVVIVHVTFHVKVVVRDGLLTDTAVEALNVVPIFRAGPRRLMVEARQSSMRLMGLDCRQLRHPRHLCAVRHAHLLLHRGDHARPWLTRHLPSLLHWLLRGQLPGLLHKLLRCLLRLQCWYRSPSLLGLSIWHSLEQGWRRRRLPCLLRLRRWRRSPNLLGYVLGLSIWHSLVRAWRRRRRRLWRCQPEGLLVACASCASWWAPRKQGSWGGFVEGDASGWRCL